MRIVLVTAHEMTAGLSFLHSQGLVHGDLSSGESSNHLILCNLMRAHMGEQGMPVFYLSADGIT